MHGFSFYRGCARRASGHRFGGFGARFGDGIGGRGFFAGRKLGSGELQLIILALLDERPRHGYEIIKAIEETSKGFYAPSPGMVYPALTYLEEVGEATVEQEGSKKLYRITDAGRARLSEHRAFVDAVLAQLARIGAKWTRFGARSPETSTAMSAIAPSTRHGSNCGPRSSPSSTHRPPRRSCSGSQTC